MRRILVFNQNFDGRERFFIYSKRFLRRRGKSIPEEIESVDPVIVPSIKAGSMLAAPDTSLDNIREEILRMRSNSKVNENKKEEVSKILKENSSSSDDWNKFITKLRPSEAYCKGQDVIECVKAKDRTARRQLFIDAEEVLRKSNKEDTLKYLELVYNRIGSYHREEVMETVNILKESVQKEAEEILKKSSKDNLIENNNEISFDEAKQMAWVNILSGMSDKELRKLWKWGLLDFDTIESLVSTDNIDNNNLVDVKSEKMDETNKSIFSSNEEVKEEQEENSLASLPIEENIEALQSVGEVHELTATVYENMFLGFPTIDLAPVMQKVQEKQFENISERELRLLERYEEAKHAIKFPDSVIENYNNNNNNNNKEKPQQDEKESENKKDLSSSNTIKESKMIPSKMELTEAILDRALCPSNRFLHAIARHDEALRQSFEGMERIKRRALLDPIFQAAVEEAHAWEELSVRPLLHKDEENKKMTGKRVRKPQRTATAGPLLGGPFAKPFHAADIPYFYGNTRSFVPPQGRYNMPAPKLSREESVQLRSSRRKKSGIRYSQ